MLRGLTTAAVLPTVASQLVLRKVGDAITAVRVDPILIGGSAVAFVIVGIGLVVGVG